VFHWRMSFNLSPRDLQDIGFALDEDDLKAKIHRKLLALKMRDAGAPLNMIATSLSITVRTVSNYIAEFREGGLNTTMEDRAYCPESCLEPFLDKIEEDFRKEPVGCTKQARLRILRLTDIALSPSQTRRIMRRLGMRYRKAGQIPGKADGQKQLEFLDNKLRPKLQEAAEGKRKVFFVDASHFVMGAVVGMLWCFSRVFVRGASGRQRYNVLGALDSQTREVITVSNDSYISAPTVCELLEKLRASHPEMPMTLILDNARYQKCKLVFEKAEELNVELLHLPPYSPNLNIIERLWKHVKQSCLKNTYYEDFATFRGAIDSTIVDVNTSLRDELSTLFSLNFQIVDTTDKTGIL
jgi:transposase